MSLKDRDRTRPRRLVRLGIIRLGYKEKRKRQDGSEYEFPVQADHFVLTDAQELAEVYGDEPRELDVILPFPDVNRNFDAAYTVWAGGVLVCRGDGEFVEYASPFKVTKKKNGQTAVYNDAGDTLVSGGAAQIAFDWNGTHFEPGELVPCPGASKDLYPHCATCRMSAILKIMMSDPRLFRLGYYQIATGSGRNYDTILGTLELINDQAGKVNGIPFKLRMVEEQTTFRDDSGKRKKTNKWFLQLEPDPTFTRKLYSRTASDILALTSGGDDDDDTASVVGEFVDAEPEAPPPFAENAGPATDSVIQDAIENLGAIAVEIPDDVQAAMDYVTSKGTRLGDCDNTKLSKLLKWCDTSTDPEAQTIGSHVVRLMNYRAERAEAI